MEFFSQTIVYEALLSLAFAGGALSYYLGARRVPAKLKPLANAWVRSGHDPKWIDRAMWTASAISFITFVVIIGFFMLDAARDLGTPRL